MKKMYFEDTMQLSATKNINYLETPIRFMYFLVLLEKRLVKRTVPIYCIMRYLMNKKKHLLLFKNLPLEKD